MVNKVTRLNPCQENITQRETGEQYEQVTGMDVTLSSGAVPVMGIRVNK